MAENNEHTGKAKGVDRSEEERIPDGDFERTKEFNKPHTKLLKNKKSHNYSTYLSRSYSGKGFGPCSCYPVGRNAARHVREQDARNTRHDLAATVHHLGEDVETIDVPKYNSQFPQYGKGLREEKSQNPDLPYNPPVTKTKNYMGAVFNVRYTMAGVE